MMAVAARKDAVATVKIAHDSSRAAKTGTLIAFLAMLYLPMTTVAVSASILPPFRAPPLNHSVLSQTIVSMPIFNYENDWRDWRYRPAPQPDSSSGNGTNSSVVADPPVFSGYFWIYLTVSICLSFATIEVWWRMVRNTDYMSGGLEQRKKKLTHWTLYPVWPLLCLM